MHWTKLFSCALLMFHAAEFIETKITSYQMRYTFISSERNYTSAPDQYVSGSIHYFRVHSSDWRDRLQKLRWAGCHAVQTYVEWASHEPEPGIYDFEGKRDLATFVQIAQEEGLFVILRLGPYICAERDMGGIPYWLLRLEPLIKLRTSDSKFMSYVKKWFGVLLPILKPLMYDNGGPIIMIQVENEYGIWDACDFQYLTDLATIFREGLGSNATLFSTDNGRTEVLKCDKIPGVYATVDFGPDANFSAEFEAQRLFEPRGPLINSEFYTGWLDHWGDPHVTTNTQIVATALKEILEMGAAVNFYVFHGGTSFGFGAGSNMGRRFQATPTSYDYDAPLTEAGDPTAKYFAIREVIRQFFVVPSGPPPTPTMKYNYGDVKLYPIANVFDVIDNSDSQSSELPQTFEELQVPNGIVAYQTVLEKKISDPAVLSLQNVHDRGYIFVDQRYQGVTSREENLYEIPIFGFPNQTLTILVESQGRISVGTDLKDFKGLISIPMINGNGLKQWQMTDINLSNIKVLNQILKRIRKAKLKSSEAERWETTASTKSRMTFHEGILSVPEEESHPRNTFVRLDNWTKGYIWINNFLLGRYWPVMGPQLTLYVPHGVLKQGPNYVLVLELEGASPDSYGNFKISFTESPELNGPTPSDSFK